MEKLKENREKRRAQQAQILEEQETLRNKVSCDWLNDIVFTDLWLVQDPADPNWEFRSMVQDYKDQLEMNPLVDGDPISR